MIISLNELFSGIKDEIIIDDVVTFPDTYLENSDIKKLENIKVSGKLYKDSCDEVNFQATVKGNMTLLDSISLDEVLYPFSCEIDENVEENIEKNKNSIDIFEVLWQNIVLEIPLKFTKVKDLSEIKGDGWRLIDEDFVDEKDNPFMILKDKMKEE